MDFDTSLEYARKLDHRDDLGGFRDRFLIDDPDLIYLDGNSLGRVPKEAISLMDRLIRHQWGNRLIRAWNDEWMGLSRRIGGKLAGLIGARPDEVIIA
ncbi:MAG: kynureninase, partial [Gemmatimonadetes bacterium]|nr:kynureninase [Gemmatimonadota bacterium]